MNPRATEPRNDDGGVGCTNPRSLQVMRAHGKTQRMHGHGQRLPKRPPQTHRLMWMGVRHRRKYSTPVQSVS